MTPEVIIARLNICQTCESYYQKTCLLGHITQSWLGCPRKKFPPVNGLGYAEACPQPPPKSGCCGKSLRYLTWPEVMAEFQKSMSEWIRAGMPLSDKDEHHRRFGICKTCEHYRHFQCLLCRCVAYCKSKLATEHCLANRW